MHRIYYYNNKQLILIHNKTYEGSGTSNTIGVASTHDV